VSRLQHQVDLNSDTLMEVMEENQELLDQVLRLEGQVETLESRVEELEGASSGAPEVEMEAGNPALGYFLGLPGDASPPSSIS